jgi:protein transport protein SEC61 subunit gamma-like protein
MFQGLKSQFIKFSRVWHLLKKPTYQEFKMTAKISALGILIIGAIGFIISVILTLIQ